MDDRKRIALIAHDNRKLDLLDWARFNRGTLEDHELYATGTTGGLRRGRARPPGAALPERAARGRPAGRRRHRRGPPRHRHLLLGPAEPQPHDVDVKALLRIAVVHDCPIACNRATADFLLSSPLLRRPYQRMVEPLEVAVI